MRRAQVRARRPSAGTPTRTTVVTRPARPRLGCAVSVSGPLDRPGADVTVTVTYPYSIDLMGIALQSGTLEAKTTERME